MTDDPVTDRFPRWALGIGPVVILAVVLAVLFFTSPFGDAEAMASAGTLEALWMLAIIGTIAGIAPVVIGMLWFPFIRSLEYRYMHAFLALSGGVLAFIAFELVEEVVSLGGQTDRPALVGGLAVAAIGLTFLVMHVVSEWRKRTECRTESQGLHVAYLVAVALGLHSVGEGLAIGTAFAHGEGTLLTLLVIGFVMHNVMEGPTVVAAVARDAAVPPLRHFAAMGLIVGLPLVVGGWIGGFVTSPVLSAVFFAVAIGAILQVLLELTGLIRFDAESVATRLNVATFAVGVVLMFVLEDVIVHGWILPG